VVDSARLWREAIRLGPIALFDKSFLQGLSVDESAWFDHSFLPVVAPFFYIETLADLAKTGGRRPPEVQVRMIADKFPDMHGRPCALHSAAAISSLMGQSVPMTGQVPVPGGIPFDYEGSPGVVWGEAPESEAFARWQSGQFMSLERDFASEWREALATLPVDAIWEAMRSIGIGGESSRSLEDARRTAAQTVSDASKTRELLDLCSLFLGMSGEMTDQAVAAWRSAGEPPFAQYAPYAAHVLSVEIFFQVAVAASLIARERPSNRTDIAYLYYLPFCMVFVSADRLHQKCAPLFLRDDQAFVWGQDLKDDLKKLNEHFLPLAAQGEVPALLTFSGPPPTGIAPLVDRLWAEFMAPGAPRDPEPKPGNPHDQARVVRQLSEMLSSPRRHASAHAGSLGEPEALIFKRSVRRRRGSWLQIPDDVQ